MASGADPARLGRGALLATVIGNGLEFYDFVTYGFFAVYIGRAFFPTDSDLASLLLSVATFGIGFLTRPLGGLWIGGYADRAGRKPALMLALALMAVGTFAIVATPSYASIGIAAPVILVLARLVQGLALGGEAGPALAVLLEGAPERQRGFYLSLQGASQAAATLLAGALGLGLATILDPHELAAWGWRVPFGVGMLVIPVAFYMRRMLPETLAAPVVRSRTQLVTEVWRGHRRPLVLVVVAAACMTISTYVAGYMTTYGQTALAMSPRAAMLAPVTNGLVSVPVSIWGGTLCDRFGRKRVMIVSCALAAALSIPAFMFLVYARSALAMIVVVAVQTAAAVPGRVAGVTVMTEVFPQQVRGVAVSFAYAMTVTLFGSTTQFVVAALIGATGSAMTPSFYLVATTAMSLVAMVLLPETSPEHRADRA